jgi:ribosomal protein S18 acetylase RimI-like enzyme
MLKIVEFKRASKKFKEFSKTEWGKANKEHFGDASLWNIKKFKFKALDKHEIVGVLTVQYNMGVLYIDDLIVKESHRRQGVGKSLIKEAEELAKKLNAHKIFLYTGKSWASVKFYATMGYTAETELPNHYGKQTWVIFTKYL